MLVLPNQMSHAAVPKVEITSSPSSNKRPKLSLQTSSLPITFGRSSTNLTTSSIESTTTPTHLNTFNNAYSIPLRPSPVSTTPRLSSRLSLIDSQKQPYTVKLPLGIKPILRNSRVSNLSPFPATNSASPRSARRVFFPAPKRVCFRSDRDLVEIVTTTTYLVPHSDLSDSEEDREEGTDAEDAGSTEPITSTSVLSDLDEQDVNTVAMTPQSQRQIHAEQMRDQQNRERIRISESAQSRRRKRKWEWTLAPVAGATVDNQRNKDEDEDGHGVMNTQGQSDGATAAETIVITTASIIADGGGVAASATELGSQTVDDSLLVVTGSQTASQAIEECLISTQQPGQSSVTLASSTS